MALLWVGKLRQLFLSSTTKHDLAYLLAQAKPQRPLADRLDWIENLSTWLRAPLTLNERSSRTELSSPVRIKFVLQLLERQTEWQKSFADLGASLFRDLRGLSLFAYMGLPEEKGFADQLADAVVEHFLPMPRAGNDLSELLLRLFPDDHDAHWIEQLNPQVIEEIKRLIEGGVDFPGWLELFQDLVDALQILATQIAAVGTSPSLWSRVGSPRPSHLSFVRLLESVTVLVIKMRDSGTVLSSDLPLIRAIRDEIEHCEASMHEAFAYLERNGVNMGLVFRLEHQRLMLRRLQLLTDFVHAQATDALILGLRHLLAELVRSLHAQHNISAIFRENLVRLALRVVEHAGSSGEHYITRTRSDYWHMLLSAAGGGILTVGTTVIKSIVGQLKAPAFIEALAHASNYAGSFLLMQASHFTLATKQPSMTAPALAKKLSQGQGSSKGLALAYEIRHIVRSQLAAAMGNIGLAVPTALLVAWGMQRSTGHALFTTEYSLYSVHSLHPFATLTVFYAALTGVLLWISSLMAGWVENWIAFQKIPARLVRQRSLKRVFGNHAGTLCAEFLSKNISGIVGNISLGFFLAFVPFIGKIMGLPLEVRHVTLSSAQVAISVFSAWNDVTLPMIGWAVLGIVYTGLLNFGVSFYLALAVATRAQRVRPQVKRAVLRRFLTLLREQPLSFIFPTKRSEEEGLNELIAASSPLQKKHSL